MVLSLNIYKSQSNDNKESVTFASQISLLSIFVSSPQVLLAY